MKNTSLRNPILLFLTAVIWGVAFVAQSVGMEYVGAFTFNFIRCIIGGLVLIPCIFFLDWLKGREKGKQGSARDEADRLDDGSEGLIVDRVRSGADGFAVDSKTQIAGNSRKAKKKAGMDGVGNGAVPGDKISAETEKEKRKERRTLLAGGVCCGVALCVASNLQQFGIKYTTVGKAGFITAMYIVLVPLLGIFLKKKVGLKVWVSVALAVAGLYLLCITEGFSLGWGDFLVLLCAGVFSIHILVIDYFSPKVDGVKMSCIQFFVCGLLSGVGMLIWEKPELHAILRAWMPILYAGAMSCGVAYTLQIVGQKGMNPTVASLILSLESVVSVLAGWLLLGQKLSARELSGCALMFVAIILAQLPQKEKA